jgi:hypothetical protein
LNGLVVKLDGFLTAKEGFCSRISAGTFESTLMFAILSDRLNSASESQSRCLFIHQGMGKILPIGSRLPRWGNTIHVRFGDAQVLDEAWLKPLVEKAEDEQVLWALIRDWSEEQLVSLAATGGG